MSERTRDGLEAARARGRIGGPKPKLGLRQARLAREMYEAGELTVAQIAAEFGVTRPTIYAISTGSTSMRSSRPAQGAALRTGRSKTAESVAAQSSSRHDRFRPRLYVVRHSNSFRRPVAMSGCSAEAHGALLAARTAAGLGDDPVERLEVVGCGAVGCVAVGLGAESAGSFGVVQQ